MKQYYKKPKLQLIVHKDNAAMIQVMNSGKKNYAGPYGGHFPSPGWHGQWASVGFEPLWRKWSQHLSQEFPSNVVWSL